MKQLYKIKFYQFDKTFKEITVIFKDEAAAYNYALGMYNGLIYAGITLTGYEYKFLKEY